VDADYGGMEGSHLDLLIDGGHQALAELRRRGLLRGRTDRQHRGDYCEALVARHLDATLAPVNNPGYDLISPTHGRVEVKARGLASRHLNWYHLRGLDRRAFDHLVAVELHADWTVAGAWLLSYDEVLEHRHRRRDGRDAEPTKLAVRGDWKRHVRTLDLARTQQSLG
jgi:hypothetical protein